MEGTKPGLREKRRTSSLDSCSSFKRPRGLVHSTPACATSTDAPWQEILGTPGRIASIRRHASSHGLATPSPAGAKAAITMLQLTDKQRLCGQNNLGDILKRYSSQFGMALREIKLEDAAKALECRQEELVDLCEILCLFGVARIKNNNSSFVFIGFDTVNSSIGDIIQLSKASYDQSFKHLTTRLLAFFVIQVHRMQRRKMWNIMQILRCLNIADKTKEIIAKVKDIGSVLVELGLIQAKYLSLDFNEVAYLWIGPVPPCESYLLDHNTPPHLFRANLTGSARSLQPPLSCIKMHATPLELIKEQYERETPQSGLIRKASRAEIRNAVRHAIESKTLSNNSKDTNGKYVKIKISGESAGNSLPTRYRKTNTKMSRSFKFNTVGICPVEKSGLNGEKESCKATEPRTTTRAKSFRSAVLLSTPELSKEATRSAVEEHLRYTSRFVAGYTKSGNQNIGTKIPPKVSRGRAEPKFLEAGKELPTGRAERNVLGASRSKRVTPEDGEDKENCMLASQGSTTSFDLITSQDAKQLLSSLNRNFSINSALSL